MVEIKGFAALSPDGSRVHTPSEVLSEPDRAMSHSLLDLLRRILPFFLVRLALRLCFRVEVRGLENFTQAGPRALVIANHVSSLDAVVLSAFLPERLLFATHPGIAHRWWLKPYWRIGSECSLDQTNPLTAKMMIDALRQERRCMIFPEGRPTTTGALMKIYESPGMIADKAGAALLPVKIGGLEYSYFSNLGGVVRRRLFPKVTLTIRPPIKIDLPKELKGHRRRLAAGTQLYDIMERLLVDAVPYSSLLSHLLRTRPIRGGGGACIEDAQRRPLTHDGFVSGVFALALALGRRIGRDEKTVALLMPNCIPNAMTLFAIQALGRVTGMLNFTSGGERNLQACRMAQIETIVTLRAFAADSAIAALIETLEAAGLNILYYEDLAAAETTLDRLLGFVKTRLPTAWIVTRLGRSADDPALILFTSGTEGASKGVVLSARNIAANCFQFGARMSFAAQDKAFACLPMFHSFGLTLGIFLPLFYGARTFLYPSPLHYHEIPELIYDTGATMLLGTDTFLANYARNAHPHDLYFLRYAIGGAEKIKPETRRVWAEKFGVRLFEGYGTTEASPVISVNGPMYYKAGSVGPILPGIEHRLQTVEGIKDGAELVVKGPNVMLGYLRADAPGVIEEVGDGWHNTGDVVAIDESGFLTIIGRTKRFAKIAGEMVSLAAIETMVTVLWPQARHVAVGVPHARKGETVVLLTESDEVDLGLLPDHFRTHGLTELSLPRRLLKVAQLPILGSGKVDYVCARDLAIEEMAGVEE
jgi:acyl-[acyl-carrier-protein]-phospholipid O-acyltransferase/long-chain-fatty-acid--[acyl-carrier-protein] ligase